MPLCVPPVLRLSVPVPASTVPPWLLNASEPTFAECIVVFVTPAALRISPVLLNVPVTPAPLVRRTSPLVRKL